MLASRGRMLSVLLFAVIGGLGVISSTQPWVAVTMRATQEVLEVPGTSVLSTLAPLSLAVLAMAGALAISGLFGRYLIASFGLLTSVWLLVATNPLIPVPPLQSVASTLTNQTGLAGEETLIALVDQLVATPWPSIALVLWILLAGASLLIFITAHRWRAGSKRYESSDGRRGKPVDPIDSWDELSRGSDPTASER